MFLSQFKHKFEKPVETKLLELIWDGMNWILNIQYDLTILSITHMHTHIYRPILFFQALNKYK